MHTSYNRPARFQSVITSYLREYTWCDVVKEGYSHQYNFIRIMLKVFIHKLRGLSPRANYTDRAAAAGRRS